MVFSSQLWKTGPALYSLRDIQGCSKAVDLPVSLHSCPHLWAQGLWVVIERIRLQKQIKIKLLFLQFERSQMRCLRQLIRITPRHLLAMSWWEKIMGQTQDMFKGLYLFVDLYIHQGTRLRYEPKNGWMDNCIKNLMKPYFLIEKRRMNKTGSIGNYQFASHS